MSFTATRCQHLQFALHEYLNALSAAVQDAPNFTSRAASRTWVNRYSPQLIQLAPLSVLASQL